MKKKFNIQEKWIDGTAFKDLEERETRLKEVRNEIENERRALSRRRPPSTATQASNAKHRENALSAEEYNTQDWVLRNRLQALKKDEQDWQYEKDKLHRERSLHIREMKRIQNEDASKYKRHVVLPERNLELEISKNKKLKFSKKIEISKNKKLKFSKKNRNFKKN